MGPRLHKQQVKYFQKRFWKVYASLNCKILQLHSVLAVYEQENVRNNEPPNYSKMETSVRLKNGDISETSE